MDIREELPSGQAAIHALNSVAFEGSEMPTCVAKS
jgi:hypothetical protein